MIHELAPPADLADCVDALWESTGSGSVRVLPDGCADLVIDLDAANALAVGTMTRPLFVTNANRMLGVRFRPGYAAAFFGVPLVEFTDQRAAARDRGMLAARISDARSQEERLTIVTTALRRVLHERILDRRVSASVDRIVQSGGRESIENVCSDVGISRQHLARLFAHHVGVAPKMFARIARFRRVLRLSRRGRWADVASELGYFDQSHLIAEFREFAGDTPVPFLQSR
jgi:AraC-like DNA-binding protein